ncbi:RAD5 [Symbiodinium sp. CCMP2456]|nr:RAD5 [Symbiodinium sp. CCMP2456]
MDVELVDDDTDDSNGAHWDTQVAELASLLDISTSVAAAALQQSHGCWELAVDLACDLNAVHLSAASSRSEPSASSRPPAPQPWVQAPALSPQRRSPRLRLERCADARPHPSEPSAPVRPAAPQPPREDHVRPVEPSAPIRPAAPQPPVQDLQQLAEAELPVALQAADEGFDSLSSALASLETPTKRRRLEMPPNRFHIPNNSQDATADNPPLFRKHPLRDEQLRSLGWMLSQEALPKTRRLRGGLLADRMGFGKTSVAIGLSSLDATLRPPRRKESRNSGFVPSLATLIMCPSHLLDQWKGEFWKFLGEDGVQISTPQDPVLTDANSECIKIQLHIKDFPPEKPEQMFHLGMEVSAGTATGVPITYISQSSFAKFAECVPRQEQPQVGDRILTIGLLDADGKPMSTGGAKADIKYLVNKGILPRQLYYSTSTAVATVQLTVRRRRSQQVSFRVEGSGQVKILVIQHYHEMNCLEQRNFCDFHVVLASTGIHASTQYATSVTEAVPWKSRQIMGVKVEALREMVQWWSEDARSFDMLLKRSPALFEIVSWRRVILDEFHESEAWEYRVREMLRGIKADHKWGLSGTPPMETGAAVAELAGLLNYIEASEDESKHPMSKALWFNHFTKKQGGEALRWFRDPRAVRRLNADAQKFVDKYIRQNTSDLVERIRVQEHEEVVEHTSEERLIYRQACHDRGIFDLRDGYTHLCLKARAELLKRCAHFDMGEGRAGCAGSAIEQLGSSKRTWRKKVEAQLWIELARATGFGFWTQEAKTKIRDELPPSHPEVAALLEEMFKASNEELLQRKVKVWTDSGEEAGDTALQLCLRLCVKMETQDGELRQRPVARLVQPLPEEEYYTDDRQRHLVVHAVAKRARHAEADDALSDMAICENSCDRPAAKGMLKKAFARGICELMKLLDKAHRSVQFYEQQLKQLSCAQGTAEEHECSICLESASDLGAWSILPCSHIFHTACIREVLQKSPLCPECRAPIKPSEIASVVMELREPVPVEPQLPPDPEMSQAWKRHGSKLNAVARRLKEIRRKSPEAKALVFVQWADLEDKVCMALQDHGVSFLRLSTCTKLQIQDGAILRRFQEEQEASTPRVLVLSLQRAASGTNLTAASHVLFVHPMNAESVEEALAYESQAVARVRRCGQTSSAVTVWRFFTAQTVEEHIHKLHFRVANPDT